MRHIPISLKGFVATARFGPVGLHMDRSEVRKLLGQPHQYRDEPPIIWKYGGMEVVFEEEGDTVSMIFMDDFDRPKKWIDPWVLSESLTLHEAEMEIQRSQIAYRKADVPALAEDTYLITDAAVYLQFSHYEKEASTLVAVFCSAFRSATD